MPWFQYKHSQAIVLNPWTMRRALRLSLYVLKRSAAKLILGLLMMAIIAVLIHTGYRYLTTNQRFALNEVIINDNCALSRQDIQQLYPIRKGENIFTLKKTILKERIQKQPGVLAVEVGTSDFHNLVIDIQPRIPVAWLSLQVNEPAEHVKQVNGLLCDATGYLYPCTSFQLTFTQSIPVIYVQEQASLNIQPSSISECKTLQQSLMLLDHIQSICPELIASIQSIRQINDWSLIFTLKQGTVVTIGLGEFDEQIHRLLDALEHAKREGRYQIKTINVIPKYNVPITTIPLVSSSSPPAPR